VAVLALLPTAPFVGIILGVTTKTGCRRVLMALVLVAIRALCVGMFADECEARYVVIKVHLKPVIRVVTFCAIVAEEVFVHVVLEMTVDAFTRSATAFGVRLVAAGTLRFSVLAQQLKVRQQVVKRRFIQTKDIGVAALMICVAGGTQFAVDSIRLAMKAGSRIHITRNVLMTIEAQCILAGAIKGNMAGGALRLEVCVALD